MTRRCANPDCDTLLGRSYRRHARYCSARCRAEAARKRGMARKRTEAHSGQENRRKRRNTALVRPRRATRDGRGSKVYLLPEEIDALLERDTRASTPELRRGRRKLRKARARAA